MRSGADWVDEFDRPSAGLLMGRRPRRSRPLIEAVQKTHPNFLTAVRADLELALAQRGESVELHSTRQVLTEAVRLAFNSDAFGGLCCYRLKADAQRRGIPVVPQLAHRAAIMWAQICIGDPVLVEPGVIVPHGQLVIDGFTRIGTGARLRPFVTIGLKEGDISGPTLGPNVSVGTGAKILGGITIGEKASVGANAVVLSDVAAGVAVVGMPARPIG